MTADEVNERHREVAVVFEDQLKGMNQNHRELNHLEDRQEGSPPSEVFLRLRNRSDQHQIAINDDMDKLKRNSDISS